MLSRDAALAYVEPARPLRLAELLADGEVEQCMDAVRQRYEASPALLAVV